MWLVESWLQTFLERSISVIAVGLLQKKEVGLFTDIFDRILQSDWLPVELT